MAQCTKMVYWVGDSQERFDELFVFFLYKEYRVAQRAARPLSYCVTAHPKLIRKHWKRLIGNLKRPDLHDAVKRNSVRFLQHIDIPEKYRGDLMNICFGHLPGVAHGIAGCKGVLNDRIGQPGEVVPRNQT